MTHLSSTPPPDTTCLSNGEAILYLPFVQSTLRRSLMMRGGTGPILVITASRAHSFYSQVSLLVALGCARKKDLEACARRDDHHT
jgi:hypothetical protein